MNFKMSFFSHLRNSLRCKYVDTQTSLLKMILEEKILAYIIFIKTKCLKKRSFLLGKHYHNQTFLLNFHPWY